MAVISILQWQDKVNYSLKKKKKSRGSHYCRLKNLCLLILNSIQINYVVLYFVFLHAVFVHTNAYFGTKALLFYQKE